MADYSASQPFLRSNIMLPAALTDLYRDDVEVDLLILSNTHTKPVDVTVQDKQTPPFQLVPGTEIGAKATLMLAIPGGMRFYGGLSYVASVAGKVQLYIRGRVR